MAVSKFCLNSLLLLGSFCFGLSQGMKHQILPPQTPPHPASQNSHAGTSPYDVFLNIGKQSDNYGIPKDVVLLASIGPEELINGSPLEHQTSHGSTLPHQSSLHHDKSPPHQMRAHGTSLQERPGSFKNRKGLEALEEKFKFSKKFKNSKDSQILLSRDNDKNQFAKGKYKTLEFPFKVELHKQGKSHPRDDEKRPSTENPKKSPAKGSLGDLDEIWRTHEVPQHDHLFRWPSTVQPRKHHLDSAPSLSQGGLHLSNHLSSATLKSKYPTERRSKSLKFLNLTSNDEVPDGSFHGVKSHPPEVKSHKIYPELLPSRNNHSILDIHSTRKNRAPLQDTPHSIPHSQKTSPLREISDQTRISSLQEASEGPDLELHENQPTTSPLTGHRPEDKPTLRPQPVHQPTILPHHKLMFVLPEQLHAKPGSDTRHSTAIQPKVDMSKGILNKGALRSQLKSLRKKTLANILNFLYQFKNHVIQNENKRLISLPNLVWSFNSGTINATHGRLEGLSSMRMDGRINIKIKTKLESNPPKASSILSHNALFGSSLGANFTHMRIPLFIKKLSLLYDSFKVYGQGNNESAGKANFTANVKLVLQATIYQKPSSDRCEYVLDNAFVENIGEAVVKLTGVEVDKEFERELILYILGYIERPAFIGNTVRQIFHLFMTDFKGKCIYYYLS